jgi:hypothetical protein
MDWAAFGYDREAGSARVNHLSQMLRQIDQAAARHARAGTAAAHSATKKSHSRACARCRSRSAVERASTPGNGGWVGCGRRLRNEAIGSAVSHQESRPRPPSFARSPKWLPGQSRSASGTSRCLLFSIHNRGGIKMQREFTLLVSGLILLLSCGCVTTMLAEKAADTGLPPKTEEFSFDLSTPGAEIGQLVVQCRQPTYQLSVDKYAIKIDAKAPLVVSKQSDTVIKLDVGKHSLKLYAVSSEPAESEKVSFGTATTREIGIIKATEQKLKYTGPIRLFGEGKFEVIP